MKRLRENMLFTAALANRCVEARLAAGLTQHKAAECLGWNRVTLTHTENCQRRVTVHDLLRFAELYGKPVAWFLEGLTV